MKHSQFRIRTLVVIMTFVAVLVAWWVDHRRMQARIDDLEKPPRWETVVVPIKDYIKRLE